jgi:hypothetical protein
MHGNMHAWDPPAGRYILACWVDPGPMHASSSLHARTYQYHARPSSPVGWMHGVGMAAWGWSNHGCNELYLSSHCSACSPCPLLVQSLSQKCVVYVLCREILRTKLYVFVARAPFSCENFWGKIPVALFVVI